MFEIISTLVLLWVFGAMVVYLCYWFETTFCLICWKKWRLSRIKWYGIIELNENCRFNAYYCYRCLNKTKEEIR